MITIKIKTNKSNIMSFDILSHALENREAILAGDAYDMICNSVSVLSQSVIIGLDEVLKLNVNYQIKDGFLSMNLEGLSLEQIKQAQVLLKTFELSIISTIQSLDEKLGIEKRKKYITLINEEV